MSKIPAKVEPYMDELRYWNYGDNPAFKKFAKIVMENTRGKKLVDHRTHVIGKGVRLSMARNFDDFLQRDLKAINFLRSFCVWSLSCMFFYATTKVARRTVPIGRFGIRKINQTQFYQNFGWLGLAGLGAWWGASAYFWWKCTRFMVHKFYRHIIQQNRNWIHENLETSRFGNYYYPQSVLTMDDDWHASKDKKDLFTALPEQESTYFGPYTAPPSEDTGEQQEEE